MQILLVAAMLLCSFMQASSEAPKGSKGFIDFRHYDAMVDPRVPCPHEGVFPHPRNCSWYYRCHSFLREKGSNSFHRFFFECEPGTVFSDTLDQCVFPYMVPRPCGLADPIIRSPRYKCSLGFFGECHLYDICATAQVTTLCQATCLPGTSTSDNICEGAALFNPKTDSCVDEEDYCSHSPTSASSNFTVPIGVSSGAPTLDSWPIGGYQCMLTIPSGSCNDYNDCHTKQAKVKLCDAVQSCVFSTGQTYKSSHCFQAGNKYNLETRTCQRHCRLSEPETTTASQTTTTTVSTTKTSGAVTETISHHTGTVTCSIAVIQGSCEIYTTCDKGESVSLCEAEETCEFRGIVIRKGPFCQQTDAKFDPVSQTCKGHCGKTTTTVAPDKVFPIEVSLSGQQTLVCSLTNVRPEEEWIKRKYCKAYPHCLPGGIFVKIYELCSNYYECQPKDGVWTPTLKACPQGQLFSYKKDKCIPELTAEELCT